jgi:high-affinity Fe2+/Pb2+ permease
MRYLGTILGVIVAVVIAWFVVDLALHFVYLVFRLVLVAIVAVVVFFALRYLLRRPAE